MTKRVWLCGVALATGLVANDAFALRCDNRLILEGMTEERVIELCGAPESTRSLGYVLRPAIVKVPAHGGIGVRRVYSGYHQELIVTEMRFNFGPRKLIRILRFEGGLLQSISTDGYGYRDRDR